VARSADTAPTAAGWPRALGALPGFLILVAVAAASGILTPPGAWYEGLTKPPGTPPDLVFPIAWTLLYALMAVAAWLVWLRVGLGEGLAAFVPFLGQLGANGLWSPLFFGYQLPLLALVDLVVLWGLIALTMRRFHGHRPLAAGLLAPYLLWVTYAGYLNAGILLLN